MDFQPGSDLTFIKVTPTVVLWWADFFLIGDSGGRVETGTYLLYYSMLSHPQVLTLHMSQVTENKGG